MSLKRALVVDDSKVARLTLKKQLEKYHLNVEVAESGEAAIELLKTHMVDVIFMDHVMPGMDGLEAVSLIKSNPLTATIPVMMYTSKEGEVYVSEARALGAVGVLPKQVQPGVLFGMLVKLGLVKDRRTAASDDVAEIPATGVPDRRQRDSEPAPVGFEISALMTRMLEDQHSELRSDIRSSYQEFAKQVANEVHEQLREHYELEKLDDELDRRSSHGWQILSGVLAIAAMLLLALFVQVRSEREAAFRELGELTSYLEQLPRASSPPAAAATDEVNETASELTYRTLLDPLIWSMNESGAVPFGERPFDDIGVDQVTGLLWRLSEAGFQGTLRIDSHLGEFCLVSDAAGIYQLQDPDAPFTSCSFIGHPLDDSTRLSDRQTPSFEVFRETSPLLKDSGIDLDIVLRDRSNSYPRVPYPDDPETAGEWNSVASQNNRLEYSLFE